MTEGWVRTVSVTARAATTLALREKNGVVTVTTVGVVVAFQFATE
jgi:hypothetical protein